MGAQLTRGAGLKGEWGVPIALQVTKATTTPWAGSPVAQGERQKPQHIVRDVPGLGAGAEKGAGEAREQGNGLSVSQRGLPERGKGGDRNQERRIQGRNQKNEGLAK